VGWAMAGVPEAADRAAEMLRQADGMLRDHGIHPSAELRSLLAWATDQRMGEFGEPFFLAMERAAAAIAHSALRGAPRH